jgi:outer membrane protein assembly factor BamB
MVQPGDLMERSASLFWLIRTGAAIAALLFMSGGSEALADDWPQFRGPNRDGVWNDTGVMQAFPAEGLKVVWRVPVGSGLSSPIVSNGRVFLCDSELKKPKAWERVRCFDEKSGALLWAHSDEESYPDWAFDPKSAAGPDATPITDGGKIYALGKNARLMCLDVLNGALLWQNDLRKIYDLAEFSGDTPSPLIEGSLLIVVAGGKPGACVIAFDKDSGKEAWRALDDKWTYSSPIVISAGGKRQLIVVTPDAVTSLDPASGKTWWREVRETPGDHLAACPVCHEDLLLAAGIMFRLSPDKPAASVMWPDANTSYTKRIVSQTSIPLIQDGCVFSDKSYGHLVCMDALTGKLLWQNENVTDKRNGAAQQLYPNGDATLVFTNEGNLIRARLSRSGYQEMSRVHLIEPTVPFSGRKVVWPLPAFADRLVFARNDQELICASLEARP